MIKPSVFIKSTFTASIFLFFAAAVFAADTSPKPLPGSLVGIAYLNPSDNQIYDVRGDDYFHPASTQKIITALAAVLYLGPDYRLKTLLQVSNESLNNNDGRLTLKTAEGILNSDVVIRFSGDPTLTSNAYAKLLQTLSTQKITKINGRVLLDVSRFGGPGRAKGWSWDDLPVCFTAPSSAIIINRNCTYAELKLGPAGTTAEPVISPKVPIAITSDAIAVDEGDYGGDCELESRLFMDNKYHVTGCVPVNNKGKNWPLTLAVSDAMRWGIDWTSQILADLGIEHNGVAILREPVSDFSSIAEIASAPLGELISYMMRRSNNLYADAIAKNLAYEYYSLPATYDRAVRAMRSILNQYANIDLGDAYLVDGSGLSPHNLITPKKLLELLIYIKNNDDTLNFIDYFPVAAESGTMQWRRSTVNPPLAHNVIAKTGTLQNVSNLAGFIRTENGALAPFVMFTNSITYSQRTRDLVRFRRMASPHYGFERYVLENIYKGRIISGDF